MKLCLYKNISRNAFLVPSHESFIYSESFVLEWLKYISYMYYFTLFYYHLISNILLHV